MWEYETLFPGRSPPSYPYIIKTAKEVGGAGRLAQLLWMTAAQRVTGDPLRYCKGIHKKGGQNAKTDDGDKRISIQGHTPRAATSEEFYGNT